ncbi:hypothetical protein H7F51_05480 [Novosphingobium flavum]|uniref:Uncharacterized protein n=1 Tax=Novosphingobium flavum TaxID=1778672 RepID=A0A7X1FQC6_9SPHN|nr:hypothetical protein [Novosphingobium flavum]MBC2664958.1 hypothetical protein [Novosphingobium flavum]
MDTITIDGMDEHDFRYEIEDMLRLDRVDDALARLRALLEPYAGLGGILPARFLDISVNDVEFGGWQRLASRLGSYDRPNHPISAIGVALADARVLGGPGPSSGRLAPFIKTFYFSDDAYPFTDATRDDLLDGYTREGFGWQSDYQASDATLSIKGIDDLHGAIVELEDRLFDHPNPPEDYVRAGAIGACYLAVLIHQALRETIRRNGLPRPLCVLAACDGVYPFFDAPVAGSDECEAAPPVEAAPEDVWPNELEGARPADEDLEEAGSGEGSLLGIISRKGTKAPVMVLGEADMAEAARFNEMAAAQWGNVGAPEGEVLRSHGSAAPVLPEPLADDAGEGDWAAPQDMPEGGLFTLAGYAEDMYAGTELGDAPLDLRPEDEQAGDERAEDEQAGFEPAVSGRPDFRNWDYAKPDDADRVGGVLNPSGHSLRSRFVAEPPVATVSLSDRLRALLGRIRLAIAGLMQRRRGAPED